MSTFSDDSYVAILVLGSTCLRHSVRHGIECIHTTVKLRLPSYKGGRRGTIKDRNGMDLTEAEDIKKRCQEYTEELYKKDLHDPDNHDGMITNLEPDILECEVKWALGSITEQS